MSNSTKKENTTTSVKANLPKRVGPYRVAWQRLRRQKVAVICMIIIAFLLFMAFTCDIWFDFQSQAVSQNLTNKYAPLFTLEHFLGTDQYGRDLFVRIMYAIRTDLLMGGWGSFFAILVALPVSTMASFYGGRVDNFVMRCCDVLNCIPGLVLTMAICAGLGGGTWQLIFALSVGGIAGSIRMIRSRGINVANSGYIESAVALGASPARILRKCMIPNVLDIVFIVATGRVAQCIMMGTALSFIGLGVQSPTPEWGLMLNENVSKMQLHPEQVIVPAIAIIITTVSVATLGDYLRDAFDPKLKGKM